MIYQKERGRMPASLEDSAITSLPIEEQIALLAELDKLVADGVKKMGEEEQKKRRGCLSLLLGESR